MNGLSLAYLGDAYYELKIRQYLLSQGITKVDALHKQKVLLTSSKAQATIINHFLTDGVLDEHEMEVFKKGRNAAHFGRRNVDVITYQLATGFESLIGYLSIYDETRCEVIIKMAIRYIKGE